MSVLYCSHFGKVTSDFEGLCFEGLGRADFFSLDIFFCFFSNIFKFPKAEDAESPST